MLEKIGKWSKKASVAILIVLLAIALVVVIASLILSPWV